MFEGFEERYLDVAADVTIHCVVGGSGPPVLLLHGYPQSLALWCGVAPILAERFTVVCADLRGYGDSSKPNGAPDSSNYSFRTMAGDQVTLMHRLGFDRFHLVGHDRGGRTGHRMALDTPAAVESLAGLDIAPTYSMFMETDRHVAGAYWHWYFLSLPAPFPERMIGADPDYFFETCFETWGKMPIGSLPPAALAEYRRCWRDPAMIHGSCNDYRAAPTIDLAHDEADIDRRVVCPTLALWGSEGFMHQCFDMAALWGKRCSNLRTETLPGAHFFVDQFPTETAAIVADFLGA
ncbi:MAG: haloacetate dehalogenase [Actinomycetota bacterium]|nr:haloacetate dehalogenase [Actinomycetota bacterium]